MDTNDTKKSPVPYNNPLHCNICDYTAKRISDFNKHLQTKRHTDTKLEKNDTKNKEYNCDCGKSYRFKSGWYRHTKACKLYKNTDKILTNTDKILTPEPKFICGCGRKYKHRQSLFTHKRSCTNNQITYIQETSKQVDSQQDELQIKIVEQFQQTIVNTLKELLPKKNLLKIKGHLLQCH